MKANSFEHYSSNLLGIISISGDVSEKVENLGFSHSNVNGKLCTFILNQQDAELLGDNVNILITKPGIVSDVSLIVYTDNPKDLFYQLQLLIPSNHLFETVVSNKANVSKDAIICDNNVTIEDDVIIEAGVIIKNNTYIGKGTVIRSGCVIGGEGFQIHKFENGITSSITHKGSVYISNNVEIQQNTTIDKAIFNWDSTIINQNTKIASQVQIAHGCNIGPDNLIASGCNFGGRVKVGKENWFGLNAIISNGITIGDFNRINLGSVVTQSIPSNTSVSGNFAIEHEKFIANLKGQVK